jgi:Protein of unknown function (DUF3237)
MNPPRRHFLDKSLLYLFSYNIEVEQDTERIGLVPSSIRFNANGTPDESRVYHVLRERSEGGLGPGFKVLTGRIREGADHVRIGEDDVAVSQIRMMIETDDGALVTARYRGIAYLRMGGYRAFVGGIDRVGTEKTPTQAPLVITPQFETSSPDYAWLMNYQCVGFGRVEVIEDALRRLTYDIYAMT